MLLTIKFVTLATLFVVTGGAVFSDWGRRHRLLVLLASVVAIVASTYLLRDILEDFRGEMRREFAGPTKQEAETRRRKLTEMQEAMADVLTGDPSNSHVSVVDADHCVAQFLDAKADQYTVYFNKMAR